MAAPATAIDGPVRRAGAASPPPPTARGTSPAPIEGWEAVDGVASFRWAPGPRTGERTGAAVAAEAARRLAATVVAGAAVESIDERPLPTGTRAGGAAGPGRATLLRIGPQRVLVDVALDRRYLVTLRRP